jgi:hypothetical protein
MYLAGRVKRQARATAVPVVLAHNLRACTTDEKIEKRLRMRMRGNVPLRMVSRLQDNNPSDDALAVGLTKERTRRELADGHRLRLTSLGIIEAAVASS